MRFELILAAALASIAMQAATTQAATTQAAATQAAAAEPADTVYEHGVVYTVDARDSVQSALAVHAGRIAYVGTDSGAVPFIGPQTKVIDLRGRMLMPGLVDGHSHPLQGGTALLK
jgi:predicted amidohydrolase YtcJ